MQHLKKTEQEKQKTLPLDIELQPLLHKHWVLPPLPGHGLTMQAMMLLGSYRHGQFPGYPVYGDPPHLDRHTVLIEADTVSSPVVGAAPPNRGKDWDGEEEKGKSDGDNLHCVCMDEVCRCRLL